MREVTRLIGSILTYQGEAPSALDSPDVARILELFKQQNEVLKLALTTCVIIPAGTRISQVKTKKEDNEDRD